MKNVNVNKGFYKVKIYIKGNEGYGWDDPDEVFHLDYTSLVEIKNDTILTEKILLKVFEEKLPKFGNYFIERCKVEDVTELYDIYLTRKKEYSKGLMTTNIDLRNRIHNLIEDLARDLTDEFLDIDNEEVQFKTIEEGEIDLTQQLSDFEYNIADKINRVMSSSAPSLKELQDDFYNLNEWSEIMFSTKDGHLWLHYTYRECGEDGLEVKSVYLPDLFVEDFEEFMRRA